MVSWSQRESNTAPVRIVVGTADSVPLIGALVKEMPDGVGDLPLLGPDGYAVQTLERDGKKYLLVAGATPRAVYYAAVYAGEQVILPQSKSASSPHGAAGPNAELLQDPAAPWLPPMA